MALQVCFSRHTAAAHAKIELPTKQGNACVVVRPWDRRQVRMNVGEVVVRQDMFAVGGIAPLVERTNAENDSYGSGSGASTLPLLATDPWPCVPWHCQQPYFMKATLPCSADAASAAPSPKSAPAARTASTARNNG